MKKSIPRSLIRVERSLECLLIPEKADVNGNTTTKKDPIEEWNEIGGLVDVKEVPLDFDDFSQTKSKYKWGL
jgi:hypothetical protein